MAPTIFTDVLIVGCGPAGLTTAISIKHKVPSLNVLIVDALPQRAIGTKATVMYPATMEVS